MTDAVIAALGGIGLFLFGMQTMTDSLRSLASRRMRAILARFTTSPLTGVLTGAATTAVVQSSSATVLTVIGFVGAGLLTFPQAVGVVFGANVGTTVTGWMVAVLGLRLQLGTLALPLVAAGALAAMLGGPRLVLWGRFGAGFALVFVGLDMMQGASAAVQPALAAVLVPADSLAGRLVLVLAGAAVTAIVQSSSVGVAMTLVLLVGGAVDLVQAAALVIGMDVGTTLKSALATLGGARDARRTAAAHVGYNLVTGVLAFAVLGAVPALGRAMGDDAAALVAFHTAFNVAGVIVMLPALPWFARAIEWLVPGGEPLAAPLTPAMRADPAAATDAACTVAGRIASVLFAGLAARLRGAGAAPEPALHGAVEDLEAFLIDLSPPADDRSARNRLSALMHLTDHLHRLLHRAAQDDRIATVAAEAALARPARVFAAILARGPGGDAALRLARLDAVMAGRAARLRRAVLLREHAGLIALRDVFAITDALRWLDRSIRHAERIAHYAAVAAREAPSDSDARRGPG